MRPGGWSKTNAGQSRLSEQHKIAANGCCPFANSRRNSPSRAVSVEKGSPRRHIPRISGAKFGKRRVGVARVGLCYGPVMTVPFEQDGHANSSYNDAGDDWNPSRILKITLVHLSADGLEVRVVQAALAYVGFAVISFARRSPTPPKPS